MHKKKGGGTEEEEKLLLYICSLCICARLLSRLDASKPWHYCSACLL